jgi:hypothetical protein
MRILKGAVDVKSLAKDYDSLVLVCDYYECISLVEKLELLGVNVLLYPFKSYDAPTVHSILGVVGYIVKNEHNPGFAVVDNSPGRLLEHAYRVIMEQRYDVKEWADSLTSPLQFRLLYLLHVLRENGVDLQREALKNVVHAFTGGDAYFSDTLLHIMDLELQTGGSGYCTTLYYQKKKEKAPDYCSSIYYAAESLDPFLEGAVRGVALELYGEEKVRALLGCKMIGLGDYCEREIEHFTSPLARLLNVEAASIQFEVLDPEEVACMVYSRYGYIC